VDIASHRIAGTTLLHLQDKDLKGERLAEPKVKAQYDAAARLQSRASKDAELAVRVGAVSLAAFLTGVLVGGWTLMTHAGTMARP
jgi:hypothetical protein